MMSALMAIDISSSLIVCSLLLLATVVEGKFMHEFILDDFTNGDSSYQPISFNAHQLGSSSRFGQQPAGSSHQQQPELQREKVLGQALGLASRQASTKRTTGERKTCHPTKPFLCPSDDPQSGECIPIQYLCDGSSDCPAGPSTAGGYDEDPLLCTAAKRPPVEETANFLRTLLNNHGPDYIGKLFGAKMSQALIPLGGPERVAIALSVSKTIEDFGKALHLMRGDIDHLRNVLVAVQTADGPMLKNLGIVRNSELADMKFFLEKLLSTGFLD